MPHGRIVRQPVLQFGVLGLLALQGTSTTVPGSGEHAPQWHERAARKRPPASAANNAHTERCAQTTQSSDKQASGLVMSVPIGDGVVARPCRSTIELLTPAPYQSWPSSGHIVPPSRLGSWTRRVHSTRVPRRANWEDHHQAHCAYCEPSFRCSTRGPFGSPLLLARRPRHLAANVLRHRVLAPEE